MKKNQTAEPIKDRAKIQEMKKALQEGQNGFRNRLLFEMGLASALRITDLTSLKKKNIVDGFVRIKTGKTGRIKLIEINPKVYQMLLIHLEDKEEDDFIFDIGRVMAWKILKDAAKKVGLSNISSHSMRKTTAWHFYHESGKDIRKTMALLGHKDPKETRIYLNIDDDEVNVLLKNMYL